MGFSHPFNTLIRVRGTAFDKKKMWKIEKNHEVSRKASQFMKNEKIPENSTKSGKCFHEYRYWYES